MATINTYTLRQAILAALKAARGAPMTVTDLANVAPHPAIRHCDIERLIAEWNELEIYSFIAPIEGFGGAYCTITEKGLRQLAPEYPQDSFIHGPGAVK